MSRRPQQWKHWLERDGGQMPSPSLVRWRNQRQAEAAKAFEHNDVLFLLGPAGTAKTFVATALAIQSVLAKQVERIILCRPAVEAGERIGFLPGSADKKLSPYMQPLFDAADKIAGAKAKDVKATFDVVPLGYCRGRTFDKSVAILDEAQNADLEQLRLFLTRIGEGSKLIITGDTEQTDIRNPALASVARSLQYVPGVAVIEFEAKHIVRHPIIGLILEAIGSGNG